MDDAVTVGEWFEGFAENGSNHFVLVGSSHSEALFRGSDEEVSGMDCAVGRGHSATVGVVVADADRNDQRGGPRMNADIAVALGSACWFHNYPALGMPGANNVKGLLLEHLREIDRLYVVKEPDAAGNEFRGRIAGHVRKLGHTGEICSITIPAGVKDPYDLQVQPPANQPFSVVPERPTTEGEGPR